MGSMRSVGFMGIRRSALCVLITFASLIVPTAAASGESPNAAKPSGIVEATTYRVRVRCDVPRSQPERQLAPNHCMNYLPDGTQTYTARVRNGRGKPVAGVWVRWTDSDRGDANFRLRQNPCRTGPRGFCSAEFDDDRPRAGEKITVRATVRGASARGFLTFRRR